jgi:predicted tellurium resistance membrane protein TerC
VALTSLEVVLGIDNIIFIVILTGKLPANQQSKARRLGLGVALVTRLLLLLTLSSIMGLTQPILDLESLGLPGAWMSDEVRQISWRDIILILGGLFLLANSVREIHEKLEPSKDAGTSVASFATVIFQIAILDIVFSLDSVITAVGMVNQIWVMVTAVILAVGIMLVFSDLIAQFVERHPTIKMLALSFLIMIGIMLLAEGWGQHINKGYIYFAMGFSIFVEFLNIKVGRKIHVSPKESLKDGS